MARGLGAFMEGFIPAKESQERSGAYWEKMNELKRQKALREDIGATYDESMVEQEGVIPTEASNMLAEQTAGIDLEEMSGSEQMAQKSQKGAGKKFDKNAYTQSVQEKYAKAGDLEGAKNAALVTEELTRVNTRQLVGSALMQLKNGNADRALELLNDADGFADSGLVEGLHVADGKLMDAQDNEIGDEDFADVLLISSDPTKWAEASRKNKLDASSEARADTRLGLDVATGERAADLHPVNKILKQMEAEEAKFNVGKQGDEYALKREKMLAEISNTLAETALREAKADGSYVDEKTAAEYRQRAVAVAKDIGDAQKRTQDALKKVRLFATDEDMSETERRDQQTAALEEAGISSEVAGLYIDGRGDDVASATTAMLDQQGLRTFNFKEARSQVEEDMTRAIAGGFTEFKYHKGKPIMWNPQTGEGTPFE